MARLIDLDNIKPMDFPSYEMDGLDVVRYLNTLPTVDAVEVVRCRECVSRVHDKASNEYWCDNPGGLGGRIRDDTFCPYGERKDND